MRQVIQAFVKPELLVWAREEAGYDIEVAAKRIGVKPKKLIAVESGQDRLTVNQLRRLSNVYKRPLAFFYLPAPPEPDIPSEKDPLAVELGRRGGLKGGRARAAKMTPEERSESARRAVMARWAKHRKAKKR